jgi:ribokinase
VPGRPRIAVIGHVEWVVFGDATRPPTPGDILHLTDPYGVPAGGGAVTAVILQRLGADVTFYTALGSDHVGDESERQLAAQGLDVRAVRRTHPQTTALTVVDPNHERTIFVIGPNAHPTLDDPLDWDGLASFDGVYYTGDDPRTVVAARRAPVVVATARRLPSVVASGVAVDAIVGSSNDPGERIDRDALPTLPHHVVETNGRNGGRWTRSDGTTGTWEPVAPPGPLVDAYGAGDSFVAGVTFGLSRGDDIADAVRLGARAGAEAVTRRGPYGGSLTA